MLLNERELKILEKFYYYKIISLVQLSKEFNITERMVRYNIDRINNLLMFIKIKPIRKYKKGYFILDNNKSNKLIEVLKELKPIDKNKRSLLIQFIISFSNVKLTIKSLTDYFQVSRITINTDIKDINKTLLKMNVKIENKDGLYILGDDKDVGKYKLALLNENIEYIYDNKSGIVGIKLKEIISKKINLDILNSIINISYEVISDYSLKLDYVNYKNFISKMIYILIDDTNVYINDEIYETNKNNHEYIVAKLKKYNILNEITILQINKLCSVVNFIQSYEKYDEYYGNSINIEVLVKNIINLVENDINIKISEDELLFEFLKQHIKSLIFKMEKGYELKEVIIDEKIKDDLYYSIKEALKIMPDIISKNIDDDEIHLLKIHFLASIERIIRKNYKAPEVIIITPLGPGSNKILIDNIKNKFLINVVFIGQLYQLDIALKENPNVKYILSTIDINELAYPQKKIIKINTILSKEDRYRLSKLGFITNNNKINLQDLLDVVKKHCFVENEELLIKNIIEIFGDKIINNINKNNEEDVLLAENIMFDYDTDSIEKGIKKACELLENGLYIDKSYTKDLIEIYKANPNYIIRYNFVILPHARNKNNVLKNGIAIVSLKKALKMSDTGELIDTIVTFAMKDEKNISNVICNIINKALKEDFRKLIKLNSKVELIKFLNN